MSPDEMLKNLHDSGDQNDYNDGLDGWFQWGVDGDVLTVYWRPADSNIEQRRSWKLVEV